MPTGSEIPASHATLYRLALASIGIGVLVLGFKFLAWRLTGSVALYSDALESIINVATAIAAFFAARVSAMTADDNHPPARHWTGSRLSLAGSGVGVLVLGFTFLAWRLTGSVALYSDALESIINVATAIAAFVAVRVSAMPADDNHPYGHTKAEYLSAVIEGVLIILAALAILREAWAGFFAPRPIDAPALGLAITGLATLVNLAWGMLLIRRGRRLRSDRKSTSLNSR